MIIPDRLATLDQLTLAEGAHLSFDAGHCAMELAAWLVGEPHSDHPECVDPTIAAFARSWNDSLPDFDRTRLLRDIIPLTIGTRGSADLQDRRAFRACDWAVRTYTPAWLRLAGLNDEADQLAALDPIADIAAAEAAVRGPIKTARKSAAAAGDAAGDAARDAARAAAGDAAWDAARAAARAAAWVAARDAARAAAGDAAWVAARDAAQDALAPTVVELQESARALLIELCGMGEVAA